MPADRPRNHSNPGRGVKRETARSAGKANETAPADLHHAARERRLAAARAPSTGSPSSRTPPPLISRRASEFEATPRRSTSSPGRYTGSSSGKRRLGDLGRQLAAAVRRAGTPPRPPAAAASSWKRATTVRASRRFASTGASRPSSGRALAAPRRAEPAREPEPVGHRLVAQAHHAPVHQVRLVAQPDEVAERLAHLVHAVGADEQRQREDDLRLLPERLLQVAAHQQVELLVGAAELDVGAGSRPSRSPAAAGRAAPAARSARAPRAASRSRRARAGARRSCAPRARAGRRCRAARATRSCAAPRRARGRARARTRRAAPALCSISSGVSIGRAFGAAARVADARGVVADDQHGRVPRVLERAERAQHDRMPERHDGRRRVDAELDPERSCLRAEPLLELPRGQHVDRVGGQGVGVGHGGRGYQRVSGAKGARRRASPAPPRSRTGGCSGG